MESKNMIIVAATRRVEPDVSTPAYAPLRGRGFDGFGAVGFAPVPTPATDVAFPAVRVLE